MKGEGTKMKNINKERYLGPGRNLRTSNFKLKIENNQNNPLQSRYSRKTALYLKIQDELLLWQQLP